MKHVDDLSSRQTSPSSGGQTQSSTQPAELSEQELDRLLIQWVLGKNRGHTQPLNASQILMLIESDKLSMSSLNQDERQAIELYKSNMPVLSNAQLDKVDKADRDDPKTIGEMLFGEIEQEKLNNILLKLNDRKILSSDMTPKQRSYYVIEALTKMLEIKHRSIFESSAYKDLTNDERITFDGFLFMTTFGSNVDELFDKMEVYFQG